MISWRKALKPNTYRRSHIKIGEKDRGTVGLVGLPQAAAEIPEANLSCRGLLLRSVGSKSQAGSAA